MKHIFYHICYIACNRWPSMMQIGFVLNRARRHQSNISPMRPFVQRVHQVTSGKETLVCISPVDPLRSWIEVYPRNLKCKFTSASTITVISHTDRRIEFDMTVTCYEPRI